MNSFVKKVVAGSLLCACITSLHAMKVDEKSIMLEFTGYKTAEMEAISGNFMKAKFTFGKDMSSLSGLLMGAKAMITPSSSNVEDIGGMENNLNSAFFPVLGGRNDFMVEFIDYVGNDEEGLVSARVMLGKEQTITSLKVHKSDMEVMLEGSINVLNFKNGMKAIKALQKVAPGHGDITSPEVSLKLKFNLMDE